MVEKLRSSLSNHAMDRFMVVVSHAKYSGT